MKNLYIIWPKGWGDGHYYLMTNDWYCLASHLCSNVRFAYLDLIEGRPERKEEWKKYLKDWYKISVIDWEEEKDLIKLHQNFKTEEKREEWLKNNIN